MNLRDVIPLPPTPRISGTSYPALWQSEAGTVEVVRVRPWTDQAEGPLLTIDHTLKNPDKSTRTSTLGQIRRHGDHLLTLDENDVPFGPRHASSAMALVALLDFCTGKLRTIDIGPGARQMRETIKTRFRALEDGRLHLAGRYLYEPGLRLPGGIEIGIYLDRTASMTIQHVSSGDIAAFDTNAGRIVATIESRPGGLALRSRSRLTSHRYARPEHAIAGLVKFSVATLKRELSGHETIHLRTIFRRLKAVRSDMELSKQDLYAAIFRELNRSEAEV